MQADSGARKGLLGQVLSPRLGNEPFAFQCNTPLELQHLQWSEHQAGAAGARSKQGRHLRMQWQLQFSCRPLFLQQRAGPLLLAASCSDVFKDRLVFQVPFMSPLAGRASRRPLSGRMHAKHCRLT